MKIAKSLFFAYNVLIVISYHYFNSFIQMSSICTLRDLHLVDYQVYDLITAQETVRNYPSKLANKVVRQYLYGLDISILLEQG